MRSRADENLDKTFEDLFQVISSERFLQRRGLGNELPFFISAHHSSLEPRLEKLVPSLATRLSNHGVEVLLLNLYDLTVEILKTRGHWDRLIEKEATIPRDRFLKTLQNVTAAKDQLVPLVAERIAASACRALLLSGGAWFTPTFVRIASWKISRASPSGRPRSCFFRATTLLLMAKVLISSFLVSCLMTATTAHSILLISVPKP